MPADAPFVVHVELTLLSDGAVYATGRSNICKVSGRAEVVAVGELGEEVTLRRPIAIRYLRVQIWEDAATKNGFDWLKLRRKGERLLLVGDLQPTARKHTDKATGVVTWEPQYQLTIVSGRVLAPAAAVEMVGTFE